MHIRLKLSRTISNSKNNEFETLISVFDIVNSSLLNQFSSN